MVNWTAARSKDKWIHISSLMLVSAIGNAVVTASTDKGARFFAMFLMAIGAISANTIVVGWIANSFPRPLVKRSCAIAMTNMIGNTSSIYGVYLYDKSTGPRYIPGGSANAVICLLTAVVAGVLMLVHRNENKKLSKAEREGTERGELVSNAGFRYIY